MPGVRVCWRWRRCAVGLGLVLSVLGGVALPARAFSGRIQYTGALGPISARRPLCLCIYDAPDLSSRRGCAIYYRADVTYNLDNLSRGPYYAIAFVDIHINERVDRDEPFQIFSGRGAEPADPIDGTLQPSDVDFVFGDENLAPTPTPTELPPSSPTATPSATPGVAGDCDGDGGVSVDELVRAVGVALESLPLSACAAADHDGDGAVRIEELIAALTAALDA